MDARRLPARHGLLWLLAGFALFRRHPPMMTALTFGYLLTVIVVNLIPTVGPFILPLLAAGADGDAGQWLSRCGTGRQLQQRNAGTGHR
jgi:hypothetical protein